MLYARKCNNDSVLTLSVPLVKKYENPNALLMVPKGCSTSCLLRQAGHIIADQTLCGKSKSGKNAGELDIVIMEAANKPVAIYEAMNLSDFSNTSKIYWDKHLSKLLDNYNPTGLPFSFLVSYVACSKDDFKVLWLNYYSYISQNCDNKYSIQRVQEREDRTFYLRSAKCIYDRAGIPTTVYHIIVRLGD